jgi:hypothetical protein
MNKLMLFVVGGSLPSSLDLCVRVSPTHSGLDYNVVT